MLVWAADEQPWKTKQVSDWTQEDARQVLADSPGVKRVTPAIERQAKNGQRGGGRRGGFGGGLRIPGIGGGRRGGYGYPGGDPGGRRRSDDDQGSRQAPELRLRCESALPIREAELKTREADAPTLDDGHYAIAVYASTWTNPSSPRT